MKKLLLRWLGLDHSTLEKIPLLKSYIYATEKNSERSMMLEDRHSHLRDVCKDFEEAIYILEQRINDIHDRLVRINVVKLKEDITMIAESLDNRRNEIDGVIETLQNLDNHDVIANLHKRIVFLENKLGEKKNDDV